MVVMVVVLVAEMEEGEEEDSEEEEDLAEEEDLEHLAAEKEVAAEKALLAEEKAAGKVGGMVEETEEEMEAEMEEEPGEGKVVVVEKAAARVVAKVVEMAAMAEVPERQPQLEAQDP